MSLLLQAIEKIGSGDWTRTSDLGIMRPSLCRLSYAAPKKEEVEVEMVREQSSYLATMQPAIRQPV